MFIWWILMALVASAGDGWLGASWDQKASASSKSPIIAHVIPGTAAETAGLQAGDLVVRIGSVDVDNWTVANSEIKKVPPGGRVQLLVRRPRANGGRPAKVTVSVVLLDSDDEFDIFRKACESGDLYGCSGEAWFYLWGTDDQKDEPQARTLYERACGTSLSACATLGYMIRDGLGGVADVERGTQILRKACDDGSGWSCYTAAQHLAEDLPAALVLFERACEAGMGLGCAEVGNRRAAGTGCAIDLEGAVPFYEKGCQLETHSACSNLGLAYINGLGLPAAHAKALPFVERACSSDLAFACGLQAKVLTDNAGVQPDLRRAFDLWTQGCDGGDAWSCNGLGTAYQYARGVTADLQQASARYEQACDSDSVHGCNNLAYMLKFGTGVEQDRVRALSLYAQGCEAGDGAACAGQGHSMEMGWGTAKDAAGAAVLYRKGCDAGNAIGCGNLGLCYAVGRGLEQDEEQAATFYDKACSLSHAASCRRLGYAFSNGKGVPKDLARSYELKQKGCAGGDAESCTNAGYAVQNGHGVAKNGDRATELYQKGCDGGNHIGCANVSAMLFDKGKISTAQPYAVKACDGGERFGCYMLGRIQAKMGNANVAMGHYETACDQGHGRACRYLADGHKYGNGLPKDKVKAQEFFVKSCTLGENLACKALVAAGDAAARGDGVPLDVALAKELFELACDGGVQDACARSSKVGGSAVAATGKLPSVDRRLPTGNRATADTAVVIGLESYPFIADVPYAGRDADAFYNFLVYTRGVPMERIRRLSGGNAEQMRAALKKAGQDVGSGGTVWVYYAGHGAASPVTRERLLLGDDVRNDPDAFDARSVAVSEVERLASAGGGQLIMMLDTCFAGVGRGGDDLIAGTRFAVPTYVTAARGSAQWTASGPNELSRPLEDARHGAFTYLAIGAMRGWADGELDGKRDGRVTGEEAQAFVQRGLRSLGISGQTPSWTGLAARTVVLSQGADERAPSLE